MDAGHTNRSINKLIKDGFLIQEQNPHDRRAHILHLTKKGEDAFRLSHELFFRWDKEALKGLTNKEQEQLMGLLQKLHTEKGGTCCVRNDSQSC